jgi:hypothetical protein
MCLNWLGALWVWIFAEISRADFYEKIEEMKMITKKGRKAEIMRWGYRSA